MLIFRNLQRSLAVLVALIPMAGLLGCATTEGNIATATLMGLVAGSPNATPGETALFSAAAQGFSAAAQQQSAVEAARAGRSEVNVNVYGDSSDGTGRNSSFSATDRDGDIGFYDGPPRDFPNDHYRGQIRRLTRQFHGFGIYRFAHGAKYVGEWRDGKRHGQGTFTWPSGNKYVGEWQDHNYHGQGTYTWADGRKYVGEWRDNKKHGQGTFTFPDGAKYVGEWRDDKRHGQGTFTFPDGARYVGEYHNEKRHGQGTWTELDGTRLVGEFRDGELQTCEGKDVKDDGRIHVGIWWDLGKSGKGKITYPDGRIYEGEWADRTEEDLDLPDGDGTMTWSDRSTYTGEWKEGKRHGFGKMVHSNGKVEERLWRNDEFVGKMVKPEEE